MSDLRKPPKDLPGNPHFIVFKSIDEKEIARWINYNEMYGYEVINMISRAGGPIFWVSTDITVFMEKKE